MFVDEAFIVVTAGSGGSGCVSFRREKFIPKGGPDGGQGGRGGDVKIKAERGLTTLMDFQYRREYRGENGRAGQGRNRQGRGGKDLVLKVPPGTMVRDADTHSLIADLASPGVQVGVAQGGKGGKGNASFATSTRRTPRIAEEGKPGERRRLHLELRLIADVGIVGLPNSGKSTLLRAISSSRPKVGDYPFTTLHPNLGLLYDDLHAHALVLADLPGLIEGAHQGKGLGDRFLRHAARTRGLLFLLDATRPDPVGDYRILIKELELHDPGLLKRMRIVVLNKIDLLKGRRKAYDFGGESAFRISALTGKGLKEMVGHLWGQMKALSKGSDGRD